MFDTDGTIFDVVRNEEDQYSIWPDSLPIPPGWTPVGFTGVKSACLERISQLWTDMRPASLRALSSR